MEDSSGNHTKLVQLSSKFEMREKKPSLGNELDKDILCLP